MVGKNDGSGNLEELRKTGSNLGRNLWRAFKDLWRFSPFFVCAYGLASITNVVGSVGAAFLFGRGLDALIRVASGSGSAGSVYLLMGGSLLLGLLEQLSFQVSNIIERRSFLMYQAHLEKIMNTKLSTLDMQRYENQDMNALIVRVINDSSWRPGNFAYRLFNLTQAIAHLIAPGILLVSFAPWMLPLLVVGSLPSLITEFRLSKIHWGFWQQDGDVNTLHWKLGALLRDKESLKEVKLFGLVNYLSKQISDLTNVIAKKQDKAIKKFTPITIASRVVETSIILGITLWLIKQVITAPYRLSVGSFNFYSSMLVRFSNAVGLVANVVSDMLTYNLYMTDYYALLDTPKIIKQPENPVVIDKEPIPKIEFINVGFAYPNTKKPVLKDFSMTIEPGERLALVGENGAGKTTIIKLLMRFYDVDKGRILINGQDIRGIDLDSWYRHIGVLFQDFNRYPFDIHTNVELGRIRADERHVTLEKAIELADLKDNIKELPYGENTILDSAFIKGVQPSGGQWQRVALARAFYRDANVLILDEPTAAIDAKAEYAIFNNIFSHYTDRTALIISHRFSTVRKADRIIVLNNGLIEEQGTHSQLLKQKSLYAEMFEKQAEGYR